MTYGYNITGISVYNIILNHVANLRKKLYLTKKNSGVNSANYCKLPQPIDKVFFRCKFTKKISFDQENFGGLRRNPP